MKAKTFAFLVVLVLAANAAVASEYDTLRQELDTYVPRSPVRATTVGTVPVTAAVPDAFTGASERLRELAHEWERALAAEAGEAAFFVPDAGRLRALSAAGTDEREAGSALSDGFTLETLEVLTLLRNPMIATKQREARAALEVFDQAEQIDAVLRRYSTLTSAAMAGGMGLPSDFPFPSVLALKGRIVAETVRAAREELEAARRDALTMARKAYWELQYVGNAAEVTRGMIDVLENVVGSVTARYEAGETNFQDVVRVRIEREKVREELKTLSEERKNMEAEIRSLLALPSNVAIGSPARRYALRTVPVQTDLEATALLRRQELRAAGAMIGRMELMQEMVRTMTYPRFDLGLFTPRPGLGSPVAAEVGMAEGSAGSDAMAADSPRPGAPARAFFAGDEAYLRELRQRIAALRSEREAIRAETLLGVRNAWFALDRARRDEALYSDRVLTLSESAIEASLRGYTAGRVMFSDLLESYTGWLEASLARERARADLGIARARLLAAVGTSNIEETK
jgi:outer membrane protein TolC